VDTVYTPKGFEGKGPGYVFSDGGVAVMLTGDRSFEAIQRDIQKKREAVNGFTGMEPVEMLPPIEAFRSLSLLWLYEISAFDLEEMTGIY